MSILNIIDSVSIILSNNNGKKIDLTYVFSKIEIFESVFEKFLHGKIEFQDTLDIVSNFPLYGNENIRITLETNQSDKNVSFDVVLYKVDGDVSVRKENDRYKHTILYFCSKECIKSYSKSISKKFNSSSNSIINYLVNNLLESNKTIDYTNSSNEIEFISNFWKFDRIISHLTKNLKTTNYSDFIFFENLNGFVFKPLSELLNTKPIQELSLDNRFGQFPKNVNFKAYLFNNYFDILSLSKNGVFGNTYFNFNPIGYELIKTENSLYENEEKITSLGKNSNFDKTLSTYLNIVDVNYNDHNINSIQKTSYSLLNQYNFTAKLNGDFNRKVGDVVSIKIPNLDNESEINERFDGYWFINSIKHIITQDTLYSQNILFSKNADFNTNENSKISALRNF